MRHLKLSLSAMLATVVTVALPSRADGQLPADFGLPTPLVASSSQVMVSYYGWENTTFYGHTLWALSSAQYTANIGTGCYAWAGGGTCDGTAMFTKSYGTSTNPYLVQPTPLAPLTYDLTWTSGTELVLALQVNMNNNWMWFFSGAPSRNADGLAHVAYFGTAGVAGDDGIGIIPGTVGLYAFGFEDVYYNSSDWDFDNAIFTISPDDISPPSEIVPEPATLTLLGSGLVGLAAARRRRRLDPDA